MLGWVRSVAVSQEKIVLLDRYRFVLRVLGLPQRISQFGQLAIPGVQRVHAGHSWRRDGVCRDRSRRRPDDRRNLRDIGRMDALPLQCGRLDTRRDGAWISVGAFGRCGQRRADPALFAALGMASLVYGFARWA